MYITNMRYVNTGESCNKNPMPFCFNKLTLITISKNLGYNRGRTGYSLLEKLRMFSNQLVL